MADINQMQGYAANGTPGENASQSLIDQLTGGSIGSSPATMAAMRAYQQNVMPTIESSLAASGGGRGGGLTAALTQGETSAYAPLVQQEIANREAAVGQEQNLSQLQSGDVSNALNASDMVRQIAQSQNSANFAEQQRIQGLIQQLTEGPLSQFGNSAMGQHSSSSSSSNPGKF